MCVTEVISKRKRNEEVAAHNKNTIVDVETVANYRLSVDILQSHISRFAVRSANNDGQMNVYKNNLHSRQMFLMWEGILTVLQAGVLIAWKLL